MATTKQKNKSQRKLQSNQKLFNRLVTIFATTVTNFKGNFKKQTPKKTLELREDPLKPKDLNNPKNKSKT